MLSSDSPTPSVPRRARARDLPRGWPRRVVPVTWCPACLHAPRARAREHYRVAPVKADRFDAYVLVQSVSSTSAGALRGLPLAESRSQPSPVRSKLSRRAGCSRRPPGWDAVADGARFREKAWRCSADGSVFVGVLSSAVPAAERGVTVQAVVTKPDGARLARATSATSCTMKRRQRGSVAVVT